MTTIRPTLTAALCAILAAGCAAPAPVAPPAPAFALDPSDAVRALGEPAAYQWSTNLVNNPTLQRMRHERRGAQAARRLQAITTNWSASSAGFASTAATGKISSSPCYDWATRNCYWITETGWLLSYNRQTAATTAVRISTTDTFPNTAVTLSFDGRRIYLVSAQGNLHVVKASNGVHATGSPLALGGTNANVTFGPPVWIDSRASKFDGTAETVYFTTASGVLKRMLATRNGSGVDAISLVQSYTLPTAANDLVRTSPVVIGGKAVIGTWRRSTAGVYNHADDQGAIIYYNTNCTSPTSATTTGAQIVAPIVLEAPIYATPCLEVTNDNALTPLLAFVPAGLGVAMVDLANRRVARSVPLVVDGTATASGNLASYTYTSGTTSLSAKYPKTNGVATVTGAGTVATTQFYGAKRISSSDANPVFGYLRYDVTDTELTSGGVLKAVLDADLTLRADVNSNEQGAFNPQPPRVFRVHNQLSSGTGTDWLSTNLTYAARPPHVDGTAFDEVASTHNARPSWELTRTGTPVFVNGLDYTWNAKGKIGQPGQDYTIGVAQTQLHGSPSLFGGLTSVPAPRFLGGSTDANRPRLVLKASNAGITNPSIAVAVAIDSNVQQAYVVSANALFKLSYVGATTNWVTGSANFTEDDQTRFALTALGADGTNAGPLHTSSTRFVENLTMPLFDGANIYVHDNHAGYGRSSISCFSPGASASATPSLSASLVLPNTGTDTNGTAPAMAYDFESSRLFVSTYNTGSSAGRAWMLNRF